MNTWEQRTDESAAQYKAFQCYLEKRSIEAAYKEYAGEAKRQKAAKSGKRLKPSGAFLDWAKFFQWEERARAYDNNVHEQTIKATVKTRRDEYEERSKLYRGMANKMHKAAAKLVDEGKGLKLGEIIEAAKYYDAEHQAEMERVNLLELREVMQ